MRNPGYSNTLQKRLAPLRISASRGSDANERPAAITTEHRIFIGRSITRQPKAFKGGKGLHPSLVGQFETWRSGWGRSKSRVLTRPRPRWNCRRIDSATTLFHKDQLLKRVPGAIHMSE